MDRRVHIALYGTIEHGPDENLAWDMYQTAELARLRDVSLSSIPSRFAPHGVATNRFQHSAAVAYLGRWVSDHRPGLREYRDLIQAAALCHDIGSPPFSHIAEIFLYALTGRTHEEQTEELLSRGGELADLLSSYGVDPEEVVEMVTGRHEPLGALIAGTIDLDNVSNSIDLLVSLGYHDNLPYRPTELVKAFRFQHGQIVLDSKYLKDILGWAEARRRLYELLYSEPNLSAMSMLYRALEFAFSEGALEPSFFRLGESAALTYLGAQAGPEAAQILASEDRWQHYPMLLQQVTREEDMRLAGLYDDWAARKEFTDRLASDLRIPLEEFALYVGRGRGEKSIALPFIGEHAEGAAALFRGRKGPQRVALFAHKRFARLRDSAKVKKALESAVEDLPEVVVAPHVFA